MGEKFIPGKIKERNIRRSQEIADLLGKIDELVGEPRSSNEDGSDMKPKTKKRRLLTETLLFTFHGGSNDGDGGAPSGQENKRKPDMWDPHGSRIKPQPPRRYF